MENSASFSASRSRVAGGAPPPRLLPSGRHQQQQQDVCCPTQIDSRFEIRGEQMAVPLQQRQQQQVSNFQPNAKCKLLAESAAKSKPALSKPNGCERLRSNQFEVSSGHSSQVRKYEQSRRDLRHSAASTPQARPKSSARKSTTGAASDATRLNSIDYFGREESPLRAQNLLLAAESGRPQHSSGSRRWQGAEMNCSPIDSKHFVAAANAPLLLDKQQAGRRSQPPMSAAAFANYQPGAQSATNTMTTDSSGFSSGGSSSASVTSQNGASKSSASSLIRSQLLEDLARLEKIAAAAAAANRNKCQQAAGGELNSLPVSPESVRGQRAASLRPSAEFDYSTLCRDEFSSFIPNHHEQHESEDLRRQRSASTTRDYATLNDQLQKQKQQFGAHFESMQDLDRGGRRRQASANTSASLHRRKRRSEQRRDRLAAGPSLVGVHEFDSSPSAAPPFLQQQQQPAESLAFQCARTSPASSSASQSEDSATPSSGSPTCDSSLSPVSHTATSFVRPLRDDNYETSLHHIPGHDRVHFNGLLRGEGDSLEARSSDGSEMLDRELLFHERQMEDQDHDSDLLRRETADRFEAQVEEFFSDESDENDDHVQEQAASDHFEAEVAPEEPVRIEDVEDPSFDPTTRLVLCSDGEEHQRLSKTLDVYLERVEALLRLAKGDKSVGLQQAFGAGSEEDEIQVSEEFKTEVAFGASSERDHLRPEVIEEIEMVEESEESDEAEDNLNKPPALRSRRRQSVVVQRRVLVDDYKSMLSSRQTSAQLNWWPSNVATSEEDVRLSIKAPQREVGEREREQLERVFLKSWLELEEADDLRGSRDGRELARVIRSHMSEFIEKFNLYQAELVKRADFATDWRSNWLFRASSSSSSAAASSKRAFSSLDGVQEAQVGRPGGDECGSKRVKMSMLDYPANNYINIRSELLHYSTVIVANRRPLRMAASCAADCDRPGSSCWPSDSTGQSIDECYRARPDLLEEVEQVARELSGEHPVDVCRLLLRDDFNEVDEQEELANDHGEGHEADKGVEIRYESSLIAGRLASRRSLSFAAHGHSFELRKLFSRRAIGSFEPAPAPASATSGARAQAARERQLETIKRLLLARLRDACSCPASQLELMRRTAASFKQLNWRRDQAKFVLPLHSLELANKLPVIQFCAKIAGALPIRVRWFRRDARHQDDCATSGEFVEISDKEPEGGSRRGDLAGGAWPLTMAANFDFETPTSWSSVWRFKRQHNDILFEIRRPHLEHDLNQSYKCVIQNYCSIRECQFELRLKREAPQKTLARDTRKLHAAGPQSSGQEKDFERLKSKLNKLPPPDEQQEAGQAILRTWSQRTLKRPPNTSDEAPLTSEGVDEQVWPVGAPHASHHTQTVGRLSAKVASKLDNEQFGSDYPYHPECLRRRLEENKLSLSLRSGTIMRYQRVARPTETSATSNKFAPADILCADEQQEYFNSSPSPAPRASQWDEDKENEPLGHDQGEEMSQEIGRRAVGQPEPRPRSRQRLAEASELERSPCLPIDEGQPIGSGNGRQMSEETTGGGRSQLSARCSDAAQSAGDVSNRNENQNRNENHSPPVDRAHVAASEQAERPSPSQSFKPQPAAKPSQRWAAANEAGGRSDETVSCNGQQTSQSKAAGAEARPTRSAVRSLISRFNNNN